MKKTFAITGNLAGFTREGAIQHIEMNGGEVVEHLTYSTDYLVAGDQPDRMLERAEARVLSAKIPDAEPGVPIVELAQALGVKVIDAEILDMMFDCTFDGVTMTLSAYERGLI